MRFIQFGHTLLDLSLTQSPQHSITLLVPLNTDNFLIVKTNGNYQILRARSNQIIKQGTFPQNFYPNQYLLSSTPLATNIVYFSDNCNNVCKLDIKTGQTQIRKIPKICNDICEFSIMDKNGDYLLIKIQNVQLRSCSICIYCWSKDNYSNVISLGSPFFNFIMSPFINNVEISNSFNQEQQKFMIIGEDDNKICYNHMSWEIKRNSQDHSSQSKQQIIIKQAGKKRIQRTNCPIAALVFENQLLIICNNSGGPIVLVIKLHEEQPNTNKMHNSYSFSFPNNLDKAGLLKYLGTVEGRPVFQFYSLKEKREVLLVFQVGKASCSFLLKQLHAANSFNNTKLSKYLPSNDGSSYYKYGFQYEKVQKQCRKQNPNYPSLMKLDIVYRIPKKYYYKQMCDKIGFSDFFANEVLQML